MATPTADTQTVRFLLDPACPWTWRTAQWMRDVREQQPLDIRWELYSLEYINRANTDNPYLPILRRNRLAIRLLELARLQQGNEAIDRLYLALGTARHVRNEDLGDEAVLRQALTDAGLDQELLDQARHREELDTALDQQYAEAETSGAFAVPTLFLDGVAPFYGPVINTVPTGEEAVSLWEDVRRLSQRPYFFEIKRSR